MFGWDFMMLDSIWWTASCVYCFLFLFYFKEESIIEFVAWHCNLHYMYVVKCVYKVVFGWFGFSNARIRVEFYRLICDEWVIEWANEWVYACLFVCLFVCVWYVWGLIPFHTENVEEELLATRMLAAGKS